MISYPTELVPISYCSNINVHLVDINVFAMFDELPSSDHCLFKILRKHQNIADGRTDGITKGQ